LVQPVVDVEPASVVTAAVDRLTWRIVEPDVDSSVTNRLLPTTTDPPGPANPAAVPVASKGVDEPEPAYVVTAPGVSDVVADADLEPTDSTAGRIATNSAITTR
jgi:hypothetical protein